MKSATSLFKHDMVHAVWSPMVELTRLRHVRYRKKLASSMEPSLLSGSVVSAGV